ncbi:uncharacterized protein LOC135814778 [Sycon ciliatum]|uniref:uncharacterized protein LOC135814778 n=1 Tax=Sycon ciliatum TaxID=27933 RepID=UPI0031F686AD
MQLLTLFIAGLLLLGCSSALGNYANSWSYAGTGDEILNPERGFHKPFTAGSVRNAPESTTLTEISGDQANRTCSVALFLCYLTDFIGKALPQDELNAIQKVFDTLASANMTAIVRFAYSKTRPPSAGPSYGDVLSHSTSLQPVIKRNADSILTIQAGFIGYRGEWYGSFNHLEANHSGLAALVAEELFKWTAGNSSRQVQVASPLYKENWLLKQSVSENSKLWSRGVVTNSTQRSSFAFARIGFHNDQFMLANQFTLESSPSLSRRPLEPGLLARQFQPGYPMFDYMTAESPFVAVDGALPENASNVAAVSGFQAAVHMRLHHYDTFSLEYGYDPTGQNPGPINSWMKEPLNATQLQESFMPAQPEYLLQPHTMFEYIRDHLGYRLQLLTVSYSITPFIEHNITFDASISNFGFSAPINIRFAYLVFFEKSGDVPKDTDQVLFTSRITSCDPRVWHPYIANDPEYIRSRHPIHHYAALPGQLFGKNVWMGLQLTSRAGAQPVEVGQYNAVRLATANTTWWVDSAGRGGVNILGLVNVPN